MLDRQIVPPSSMMSPVCIDKQLAAPRKLPKGQGPLFEGAGPKRRLPVVGDWWVASAELLRMSRHDRNPVTALPSSILHGSLCRSRAQMKCWRRGDGWITRTVEICSTYSWLISQSNAS
uniref:Uncharacterized protein n=1 Tax=Cacopsylla melanoneura TaxID=428564 RepID=A0A8D8RJC2_9HEMI